MDGPPEKLLGDGTQVLDAVEQLAALGLRGDPGRGGGLVDHAVHGLEPALVEAGRAQRLAGPPLPA